MTDRPVERTSTRTATDRNPAKQPSKQPGKPTEPTQPTKAAQPTQPTQPSSQPAAKSAPARPALGERISAKLSNAADEHRANANPDSRNAAKKAAAGGRPPRRARLRLTRVDPWSVMKTAFLLSIAFGVVTVVSVLMVWSVLGAAGVWDSINQTVQDVVGGQDSAGFDVTDYLGTSRVIGFTMLVAVIDVVLLTAIATLGAFLYNMAAALLGGLEVTLAEDER